MGNSMLLIPYHYIFIKWLLVAGQFKIMRVIYKRCGRCYVNLLFLMFECVYVPWLKKIGLFLGGVFSYWRNLILRWVRITIVCHSCLYFRMSLKSYRVITYSPTGGGYISSDIPACIVKKTSSVRNANWKFWEIFDFEKKLKKFKFFFFMRK